MTESAPAVEASPTGEANGRAGDAAVPGAPSAWWLLIGGLIGLAAALALTVEKIRVLADPGYVPSCYINPVLSCGSVMDTPQASILDVPNTLFGIPAFTVVVVTGVLALARVRLPHWYWVACAIGTGVGVGFVHWLIFASLYRIGALCPYCMVVWTVTIPLLVVFASIAFSPADGHPILQVLHRWRWTLTALWFVVLAFLIFLRFQNYWLTLI